MKINKKITFLFIVLVSLFMIFFVGREFNPETAKRNFVITTDGINHFRKGLDVSGGTKLIFRISYEKYEDIYQGAELMNMKKFIENIILKNIDNRISKLGVSDYKAYVQRLDDHPYIVVEIGGIADLDQAKEIIGKTVELEFKLQNDAIVNDKTIAARKLISDRVYDEIIQNPTLMKKLTEGKMSQNIFYNSFSGASIDDLPEFYLDNTDLLQSMKPGDIVSKPVFGRYAYIPGENSLESELTGKDISGWTMFRLISKTDSQDLSGNNIKLYNIEDVFVQDQETWITATDSQNNILNGAYFKFANAGATDVGEPIVNINFDEKGKAIFCDITEKNIGNPMAIFVGGELVTAPNINDKICGGSAMINGSFTTSSAKDLADSLNNGALPAPLILMQEEKISPTLGENALNGALWALLIGFVAIAIFIAIMYSFKDMIITSAVLIAFIAFLFALVKLSDFALSLSSIAAIILSVGMGVDANILMYERYREEIKNGKTPESAVDTSKDRSRSAIRDGQISGGLIALLLFTMGTNIFKGFGAMMLTTILITLLFNVPLTKFLMHIFYDRKQSN